VNFASSDLPSLIMLSKKILLYNDVPSAMHFTVRPEVTSYLDHTLSLLTFATAALLHSYCSKLQNEKLWTLQYTCWL